METKWKLSNRDLVVIAILIVVGGLFQLLWAILCFNITFLGPFTALFSNAGFMIWCYLALYFVPVPGVATLTKTLAAVIEVLGGNPVGLVAIAYGALEGLAVDVSYLIFRRKLSINMMIVGALLSQLFTAPIDFVRDAVPFQFLAMATYWAPGVAGTVFTGWISSVVIGAMKKAKLTFWKRPELPEKKNDQEKTE